MFDIDVFLKYSKNGIILYNVLWLFYVVKFFFVI